MMKLRFSNKPLKNSLVLYPVFENSAPREADFRRAMKQLAKTKEFTGGEGEILYLRERRAVLLGFGDAKKLTAATVLNASAAGIKNAASHRAKSVSFVFPQELAAFAQAVAEGLTLGSYQPGAPYKTGKNLKKLQEQQIETLEIAGAKEKKLFEKGYALARAVNEVRNFVNAPPNIGNVKFFEEKAREIAKETGAKLTVLYKKELEKLGMGAFLGVNRGSPDEARLIIFDYQPPVMLRQAQHDKKEPPLVFVGKGIIFDSGGYNLKPRGHIEDMQLDKAGAAALLGLIKFLPKLGVKQRIVAVMPFTENLIGPNSYKPSEILKTYSGKTVEITNTDGEGRLILADAIAYAVATFKPDILIDIATLTGACMVALGDRYAGLFGNNKELIDRLREAGDEVDELLWPLPLHKDHSEKMKGVYADLRNADIGSERYAGASKGAAFIQEFVGKTKWAHIDIASPAWTDDPKKYETKGATGFGVRALVRFLEKEAYRSEQKRIEENSRVEERME